MNVYHIWFNLKPGVRDLEFAESAQVYLGHLKEANHIVSYRITRRKLGLAPPQLPEWHITPDFENMAQMDDAFGDVSSRADPVAMRWIVGVKAALAVRLHRARWAASRRGGLQQRSTCPR